MTTLIADLLTGTWTALVPGHIARKKQKPDQERSRSGWAVCTELVNCILITLGVVILLSVWGFMSDSFVTGQLNYAQNKCGFAAAARNLRGRHHIQFVGIGVESISG